MSACRRADRQLGRSRIHHTSDGPEHPACSKRAHGLRWQKRWRRDGDAPPPSLSAIGCICGDSFSFEAAALAAASALTLPASARTWTLGHRGSVGKQASEWVSIIGEGQVRLFQSDGIAPSTQPESLR